MQHRDEIETTHTNVVAVSFGTAEWARMWLHETQSPITLLLDPKRELYHALALKRSFWRSWGLHNLTYYARAVASGRELHGIRGDASQLGGNVIVDQSGIVRWLYRSKDPTDRPSADLLLDQLQAL